MSDGQLLVPYSTVTIFNCAERNIWYRSKETRHKLKFKGETEGQFVPTHFKKA
jgi:hypothetical protein